MAANELFDTGIKVTGSFSAAGAFPIDAKFVVDTIAQRDDHDTQNRSYEGMLVYVKADGKTYQKRANGWQEFGFDATQFEGSVYDGLDSDSVILALSAKQGKVLNSKITDHESDTTAHITSSERTTWNNMANITNATSTSPGLLSAADKAKLDGIAEGANKYTHPSSHAATMITQDTTHRFVTDAQIASWNSKASDKNSIGLGNVTNDAQVKRTEMGSANGVATLDGNGKVPSAQLPSYVDDVIEVESFVNLPVEGEKGKVYITIKDGKTYRWSGTQYTVIGNDLALGETSSTAYPGNLGATNASDIAKLKDGTIVVPKADDANTVSGFTVGTNVPADAKFTDTTYSPVTQTKDGLMTKEDKIKLDGIDEGANNYVHPDDSNTRHVTDAQINAWNSKASTTVATTSANGLMSSADKTKLNNIETGANKYVHPNDANTRHVTDAQIATWNGKADKTTATITASGLMSATDKAKLDAIAEGANNYVHPNDINTRHVTDAQIATWDAKASTAVATQTSNGLMSKADKKKLDTIEISKIENMTYLLSADTFANANKVTIPMTNITTNSTITIGLDYTSITPEQYEAAALAKFISKIIDGNIEISCFGIAPSIDIPVALSIVR